MQSNVIVDSSSEIEISFPRFSYGKAVRINSKSEDNVISIGEQDYFGSVTLPIFNKDKKSQAYKEYLLVKCLPEYLRNQNGKFCYNMGRNHSKSGKSIDNDKWYLTDYDPKSIMCFLKGFFAQEAGLYDEVEE